MGNPLLYPSTVLAVMFGYQPPNDGTTPKYRAVGMARDTFEKDLTVILADLETMESVPPVTDEYGGGYVALHARVSTAALAYAAAINDVAPVGEHVMRLSLQAIDAVTFARMWANKAIRAPAGPVRGRLISLAKTESEKAQLAANAAIALDAPVSDAYSAIDLGAIEAALLDALEAVDRRAEINRRLSTCSGPEFDAAMDAERVACDAWFASLTAWREAGYPRAIAAARLILAAIDSIPESPDDGEHRGWQRALLHAAIAHTQALEAQNIALLRWQSVASDAHIDHLCALIHSLAVSDETPRTLRDLSAMGVEEEVRRIVVAERINREKSEAAVREWRKKAEDAEATALDAEARGFERGKAEGAIAAVRTIPMTWKEPR